VTHAAVPIPITVIARRFLQFFWLADHSGSMQGKKIATLNPAIRNAVPAVSTADLLEDPRLHLRPLRQAEPSAQCPRWESDLTTLPCWH
jgi:hypothetical protein